MLEICLSGQRKLLMESYDRQLKTTPEFLKSLNNFLEIFWSLGRPE